MTFEPRSVAAAVLGALDEAGLLAPPLSGPERAAGNDSRRENQCLALISDQDMTYSAGKWTIVADRLAAITAPAGSGRSGKARSAKISSGSAAPVP